MKSEEKLLKEMGISSWTLKKNFLFDGKHITKKDIKNIQTNLNRTQKQLDRQIAAFENTKSQIDDIRKQINERLDKIELNIIREFFLLIVPFQI